MNDHAGPNDFADGSLDFTRPTPGRAGLSHPVDQGCHLTLTTRTHLSDALYAFSEAATGYVTSLKTPQCSINPLLTHEDSDSSIDCLVGALCKEDLRMYAIEYDWESHSDLEPLPAVSSGCSPAACDSLPNHVPSSLSRSAGIFPSVLPEPSLCSAGSGASNMSRQSTHSNLPTGRKIKIGSLNSTSSYPPTPPAQLLDSDAILSEHALQGLDGGVTTGRMIKCSSMKRTSRSPPTDLPGKPLGSEVIASDHVLQALSCDMPEDSVSRGTDIVDRDGFTPQLRAIQSPLAEPSDVSSPRRDGLLASNSVAQLDVAICHPEEVQSTEGSSACVLSPAVTSRKREGGGRICRIDTCTADVSQETVYYKRRRVCRACVRAPSLLVDGKEARFCQQCSQLHPLDEFDGLKRSCRSKLATHRLRVAGTAPASSPPKVKRRGRSTIRKSNSTKKSASLTGHTTSRRVLAKKRSTLSSRS